MAATPMDIEFLRRNCLPLAGTTEQVQWGYDLVFKVGGKMYAVAPLEPAPCCLSFKCSPEDFSELIERPGIIPAPYLARAQWVALEHDAALSAAELKQYLRRSYELVRSKLPRKVQMMLEGAPPAKKAAQRGK
jgi:predicted DNA-binding protein (MmcQ/YjbR family)